MLSHSTRIYGIEFFVSTTALISQIFSIVFSVDGPLSIFIAGAFIALALTFTFMFIHHHFYTVKHNNFAANLVEDVIVLEGAIAVASVIISNQLFMLPQSDGVVNATLFAVLISLIPMMIYSCKTFQRGQITLRKKSALIKEETHHVFIVESDGTLYTAFIKGNTILSKDKYYDANGYNITVNTEKFE